MKTFPITLKTVDRSGGWRVEDHKVTAGTFKAAIRAAVKAEFRRRLGLGARG